MKRYLRDKLPKPDLILANKYMTWMAPWLSHPRLWHMHRHSVSLGVAIGIITGVLPGPVQILLAILVAIPLRANVLAAAAATFYTNPFTFIPLYMLAYSIGTLVTGEPMANLVPPDLAFSWMAPWQVIPNMFSWFAMLGHTLLIGLVIQATTMAILGYFATGLVWRIVVTQKWHRRHRLKRW